MQQIREQWNRVQNEVSKAAVSKSEKVWKNYILTTLLRTSLLITVSGTNFKVNSKDWESFKSVIFLCHQHFFVSHYVLWERQHIVRLAGSDLQFSHVLLNHCLKWHLCYSVLLDRRNNKWCVLKLGPKMLFIDNQQFICSL